MFKVYVALLLEAWICVLLSFKVEVVEGQSTVDYDSVSWDSNLLYMSELVANLFRKGVEKVIASYQQQLSYAPVNSPVSALQCEYRSFNQFLLILFFLICHIDSLHANNDH